MDQIGKTPFISKMKQIIGIIVFPVILYGIIGPLEVYAGNIQEFNFGIEDFFAYFLVIAILMCCAISAMIYFLPEKIRRIILAMIFSGAFLSYFQNLFFNSKLSLQDGSRMDWDMIKSYSLINALIWFVLFVAIFLFIIFSKKNVLKICSYIFWFFSAVQIVTVISLLITSCTYERVNNHYILSGTHQFDLAQNENIVVILLDRYANSEFEELLLERPETQDTLKDFTYYDNVDSHYNYTFPSLVHILTGQELNDTDSRDEWTKEIWSSDQCVNFYDLMHENGYRCSIYSDLEAYVALGDLQNLQGRFDNIIQCEPRIDRGLICRLLEKITIYKYAPYIVKPYFEVDYNVFSQTVIYDLGDGSVAYDNADFYERMLDKGFSIDDSEDKEYSFIHLTGLHGPYHTGIDGKYVDESDVPTTRVGISVMIDEYINQLKQIGMYDSTTIIIMSDHGMDISKLEPQPIFFIKCANENHDQMQVNSAPISYDDYLATILKVADIDASEYGTSIFDWNENDHRQREVLYPISNSEMHGFIYDGNKDALINEITNNSYSVYTTKFNCEWVSLPLN